MGRLYWSLIAFIELFLGFEKVRHLVMHQMVSHVSLWFHAPRMPLQGSVVVSTAHVYCLEVICCEAAQVETRVCGHSHCPVDFYRAVKSYALHFAGGVQMTVSFDGRVMEAFSCS